MGLPTNQAKGQGCNPVSSNCVIWQGPDIPCIDLCHGDSVTDVVYKLATELCAILDTLDINTYDIDCFKPICPDPKDFHDLIQFLITKVCELQCCCDGTKPAQSDCPDACVVTVAPCFYFTNQLGDQITTMTLTEYVTAIGNKLCTLIPDINTIDARVTQLDIDAGIQASRIDVIEDELADVVITLPATCLYIAGTPAGDAINAIATELCTLESATGKPSQASPIGLLQAIQRQCANMDALKTLANRNNTYSGINGWVPQASYATVADSLNNMWLTICDMRAAVENILLTCCCTDCDDVNISFTTTLQGDQITLYFTGSIPTGLTDCYPGGNFVTFTDSNGGSWSTYVEVVNNLNSSVTLALPLSVNPALDVTTTIQGCWNRPSPGSDCGGLRCERILTYTLINTAPCPIPIYTPQVNSIDWEFLNNVSGPVSYAVKLYNFTSGLFVTEEIVGSTTLGEPLSGSLTGVGVYCATQYKVIIEVTINNNTKTCPAVFVTTLDCPCVAPTEVTAGTP